MNELETSRNEISRIDAEMAKLFEQRMQAASVIAEYKKRHGLSIKDEVREKELIDRDRKLIENADIESYYVQFLRKTIDLSCEYQSKLLNGMRVTYCGVEGAFAYMAAKRMFPEAELIPYSDFGDAYRAGYSLSIASARSSAASMTAWCCRLKTAQPARSERSWILSSRAICS